MKSRMYVMGLLFCMLCLQVQGQVETDAKVTGRHAKALNAAKERKQQIKEANRQLKMQRKANHLYKERYEDLREQHADSLESPLSIKDSLSLSEEVLYNENFPPEYQELILHPVSFDNLKPQLSDSVIRQKGNQVAEQVAKEYLPDELEGEDPLAGLENPVNPALFNQRPNPNLIKPKKAQELFKKIDPEQFLETQVQLQKLKKKYSKLPDTRYPEEGTRRNSLQDIPFKKRLFFGGILSLQSTDPLVISSNLQLGYWINKKWMAGVGLTIREQFGDKKASALVTGDGYGFSIFSRYELSKGFFAWIEGESQQNRSFFVGESDGVVAKWQQAYMAGVGREFKLGKVRMMSMVLYDFNYQNNELNQRPLIFRMGFSFSQKP